MRPLRVMLPVLSLLLVLPLHAQDLATTCHVSSSYDLTVVPAYLLFDRASPAPQRVRLQDGVLRVDGRTVPLSAGERVRLARFERLLRALVPRVKAVADHGVDVAVQTVRSQAASLGLDTATRVELDQRLAADAVSLKQRIAASYSTHDWHGAVAEQYEQELASDIVPLIVADLGRQALTAAMGGDLQRAAELRDRAAALATDGPALLRQRMNVLRPQVAALCPDIRQLATLQQGLPAGDGRMLDLLQVTDAGAP
ncbi:DUF2884 family protein [Dyella sp. A6]|uniref:DUF2884 family protein n=1 Tax=Dyella aluminiiresistens TaxID=3069105 RepID=UPI002E7696F5|nr:DUF2884 family protein [Dyella sp. A6]